MDDQGWVDISLIAGFKKVIIATLSSIHSLLCCQTLNFWVADSLSIFVLFIL
uniref:HTH La-type RNA-binding domain-containing protein n=1 Tax=Arundo donax TaxID=35708 RepID=A0A0A9FAY5_ARUDO